MGIALTSDDERIASSIWANQPPAITFAINDKNGEQL